jgi:hypothetical protein
LLFETDEKTWEQVEMAVWTLRRLLPG